MTAPTPLSLLSILPAFCSVPRPHHGAVSPFFRDAYAPVGSTLANDGLQARSTLWPEFSQVGLNFPRSMFGGSALKFGRPDVFIGDSVHLTETLVDVKVREGRAGMMGIVRLGYQFHKAEMCTDAQEPSDPSTSSLLLSQELDFLCLPESPHPPSRPPGVLPNLQLKKSVGGQLNQPGHAKPRQSTVEMSLLPGRSGDSSLEAWPMSPFLPDERMLFLYSAATHNAHRIHYDLKWAVEEEGYPGLVVHGPLIQLAMLNYARDHLGIRDRRTGALACGLRSNTNDCSNTPISAVHIASFLFQ